MLRWDVFFLNYPKHHRNQWGPWRLHGSRCAESLEHRGCTVRDQFGGEMWAQDLMVTPSGLALSFHKMVGSPDQCEFIELYMTN